MNKEKLLKSLYIKHLENPKESNLSINNNHNFIFGSGSLDAKIMIIGESPGKVEDETSEPFTGKSGIFLRNTLKDLKINRKDIFITNIIKCRPPKNRNPTKEELIKGRTFLIKEIEIIKPKVICTLGSYPLYGLTNIKRPISQIKKTTFYYNNIPIISTYHPAYINRTPNQLKVFIKDLNKLIFFSKNTS
jgi:DNA polymerase